MLQRLSISDYKVLSKVEVFFQPGLNVITGETGVGKSLLLEAIGSLFGGQHNKLPVRTGCDKAVVEAEFAIIEDTFLQHWLEKNDLTVELPIILRREFYRNGRTRFFINDSPANLGLAAELGDLLIELHGQHEVISLFDYHKQLELLDSYANDSGRLRSYQKCFKELIYLREKLATLRKRIDDSQTGRDTLRLQLEELENLNPQPGEIVSIETHLVRLENSEKIFQTCSDICDRLNEAPDSAIEKLSEIRDWLPELIEYYPALKGWENEIDNTRSVLVELNRSLLELARKLHYEPQTVEDLRQRSALLVGFQKRWSCEDKDPTDFGEEIREKLAHLESLNTSAETLTVTIAENEDKLRKIGEKLSYLRKEAAKKLEIDVQEKLSMIGMEKAKFRIAFAPINFEKPLISGFDRVTFMLSPDGKLAHLPLNKVASGGEMSRILLGLKSSLASVDKIESLIFDEIDQGISGRVARMVGQQLLELAKSHQVIVVTHLPQIASLGEIHLSVRRTGEDKTAAVFFLEEDERLEELAALLTATGLSDGALLNAREMLESAKKLKVVS